MLQGWCTAEILIKEIYKFASEDLSFRFSLTKGLLLLETLDFLYEYLAEHESCNIFDSYLISTLHIYILLRRKDISV